MSIRVVIQIIIKVKSLSIVTHPTRTKRN